MKKGIKDRDNNSEDIGTGKIDRRNIYYVVIEKFIVSNPEDFVEFDCTKYAKFCSYDLPVGRKRAYRHLISILNEDKADKWTTLKPYLPGRESDNCVMELQAQIHIEENGNHEIINLYNDENTLLLDQWEKKEMEILGNNYSQLNWNLLNEKIN